jgi:hypothetical protein
VKTKTAFEWFDHHASRTPNLPRSRGRCPTQPDQSALDLDHRSRPGDQETQRVGGPSRKAARQAKAAADGRLSIFTAGRPCSAGRATGTAAAARTSGPRSAATAAHGSDTDRAPRTAEKESLPGCRARRPTSPPLSCEPDLAHRSATNSARPRMRTKPPPRPYLRCTSGTTERPRGRPGIRLNGLQDKHLRRWPLGNLPQKPPKCT